MNHAETQSSSPSESALPPSEPRSLAPKRSRPLQWTIIAAVFLLTFALRWPFLTESFWVDELHSAWCVADGWNDVAARAKMGNQQPLYFWSLWIWQQIPWPEPFASYPVESLARLTSLWCVSVSAALIAWGLIRYQGSLLAAAAAGIAFAIDRQAAFYGVELRPYAPVILCSTLAIGFAARLWTAPTQPPPPGQRTNWSWAGLHASVLLAVSMHITSLLTLAPLVVAMSACDLFRRRKNPAELKHAILRHTFWLALWAMVGLQLASHQQDVWERRDAWSAFGRPKSIFAIWNMWPWLGWILFPAAAAIFSRYSLRFLPKPTNKPRPVEHTSHGPTNAPPPHRGAVSFAILCSFALVVSVLSAFFLANFLGVPIWHRRYLIAGLPLGCVSLGAWIASIHRPGHYDLLSPIPIFLSLASVAWTQGSIHPKVASYWVYRHENWRDAIQQIAAETELGPPSDADAMEHHLWIDADLIEQPTMMGEVTDIELSNYLTLPARGPYTPGERVILHAVGSVKPMEGWQRAAQSLPRSEPRCKHWFLSRFLPKNQQEIPPLEGFDRQDYGRFGNIKLYYSIDKQD
ncbi:MAG: hypothetical protein ACF8AM_21165 [Rhodopirellula sp. JB055]|uniref:hypothetical protein n=1 Tax=Rhodopirellula sp. JB055 TaxID=3342846 RepID=UPI00370B97C1